MKAQFSVLIKATEEATPFRVVKTETHKEIVKCKTLSDALAFMNYLNGTRV